ncbi:MAG: hypothetical protein AAB448_00775 [Patescibacteria group bacterium]
MREIGRRHEFTSQDDERHRSSLKKFSQDIDIGGDKFSFGKRELEYVNGIDRGIQDLRERAARGDLPADRAEKYIASDERRITESLWRVFGDLAFNTGRDLDWTLDVRRTLREALKDQRVADLWADSQVEAPADGIEFLERIQAKDVPVGVLKAILALRLEHQEQVQKDWEPIFEQWKASFKRHFQAAVDTGMIPPNAAYDSRINDASFRVIDILVSRDVHGLAYRSGVISIKVEGRKPQEIRKTVFHELTHRVSGAVMQEEIRDLERYDGVQVEVRSPHTRKSGLRFLSHHGSREQGSWLNEGCTELLARYLSEEKDVTTYPFEQLVVKEAIDKGNIDPSLFMNAYFESRAERPVEGSRLPAFRRLHEAMSKQYGKNWLKSQSKRIDGMYNGEV